MLIRKRGRRNGLVSSHPNSKLDQISIVIIVHGLGYKQWFAETSKLRDSAPYL